MRILCVHSKTSSFWAVFVNKNRCIKCSSSIPGGYNHLILINLIIHMIVNFLWSEYFIDFLFQKGSCQAVTSVLCLLYRPDTIYCSTKMRTPLKKLSLHYNSLVAILFFFNQTLKLSLKRFTFSEHFKSVTLIYVNFNKLKCRLKEDIILDKFFGIKRRY